MKKSGKTSRVAKRPARRPVIAMRVHQPLYEQICNSADQGGLSISEEAELRLARSFVTEREGFLHSILQNTLHGRQPKFDLDAAGLSFSAEIKALIKQRLADYVDSLPEPSEPSEPLSSDDVARLRSMLDEAAAKDPSPSIRKRGSTS